MTLGEQFVLAQKRSGLTREDIKEKTGISLPTIRKMFNDDKSVYLTHVEDVARVLGITNINYKL